MVEYAFSCKYNCLNETISSAQIEKCKKKKRVVHIKLALQPSSHVYRFWDFILDECELHVCLHKELWYFFQSNVVQPIN